MSKIGSYDFLVAPFHCDFSHRLILGHLGNHLLNAADFHSNDRGYGMDYLNTIGKTWVLSRLHLQIMRMPEAYEHIKVDTWVDGVMRYFTSRNFRVTDGKGDICAYGRSMWAMIDTTTRQPVDILAVRDGLIERYIDTETPCPIDKGSRVKVDLQAPCVKQLVTNYSDIDMNGHVNSVKYIEHMLDLWPIDWHATRRIAEFEIAYVVESHCGDTLNFYVQPMGEDDYFVRITKCQPNVDGEVEVVRAKFKFLKD